MWHTKTSESITNEAAISQFCSYTTHIALHLVILFVTYTFKNIVEINKRIDRNTDTFTLNKRSRTGTFPYDYRLFGSNIQAHLVRSAVFDIFAYVACIIMFERVSIPYHAISSGGILNDSVRLAKTMEMHICRKFRGCILSIKLHIDLRR